MNVFVTGVTGFLGRAFAAAAARRGHDVTGLARSAAPAPEGVRLVRGDLALAGGLEVAREALAGADAVVHLAAVRRDRQLGDAALARVNVESGPRLLAAAARVRRFVLVSSVAVYGHPEGGPAREDAPFAPSKRYGRSKVEAEARIREAAAARDVALTIVRPGVVYGPGDTYGMVASMARLVARGRFLLVGRGANRLNFLYVDDLVAGLCAALESERAAGEDFLLAGPEAVPVARLARTVAEAVGRALPPVAAPEWAARLGARLLEGAYDALGVRAEPFLTRAKVDLLTREDLWDTTKARERLGFAPAVGIAAAVPRHVAWLREAGELR